MKGLKLAYLLVICLFTAPVLATEIGPGPVSGDWYSTGNPYNVNGEITVHADSTLSIHEGVEVIFQGHYKFIVNGILEANGVEGDSILFTAADTSIGWHSLRFISAQDTSHLSYCIVQYGIAVGSTTADSCGGGIYCHSSNVYISNCQITNNTGDFGGGGVFADTSANITLSNCEINDNSAFTAQPFGGAYGGGLCFSHCDANMTQCTVMNNHASNSMGGGALLARECNAVITDCEIAFNTSSQGGGLNIQECDATVIGCYIHDNTAENTTSGAGGICVTSFTDNTNVSLSNCTVTANLTDHIAGGIWFASYYGTEVIGTMQNCVVASNHSAWRTGGIFNQYCDQLTIDQCTVSGNSSGELGAEITVNDASSTISNTIVEGSSSNGSIRFINAPNASLLYCDVYNSMGHNFEGTIPAGLGHLSGVNANGDSCDVYMNIYMDPLFRDPSNGDYHLQSMTDPQCGDLDDSHCIDAGDPSILDVVLDCWHGLGSDCSDMGAYGGANSGWVGVAEDDNSDMLIPQTFTLYQNYPNPFNATTVLEYQLPQPGLVTLAVYNILGRKVATLFDGMQQTGYHAVTWDASDVSSGIYFASLRSTDQIKSIKMVLMK